MSDKRKWVSPDEGEKITWLQRYGLYALAIGIVAIIASIFPCECLIPISSKIASVGFLLLMLGLSFVFPTMLQGGDDGISTMRVVVYMIVAVFITLIVKDGWNTSSFMKIDISSSWMYIILAALGGKAVQSYSEMLQAKNKITSNNNQAKNDINGGADKSGVSAGITSKNINFTDHNGLVLNNTQVYLIFWGKQWSSVPNSPTCVDILNAFNNILSSTYLNNLQQYRINNKPTLCGNSNHPIIISSPAPQKYFSDSDVQDMIKHTIGKKIPQPSVSETLYLILLPPNFPNSDGDLGSHCFFPLNQNNIYYGWVTNDGDLASVTSRLTHEFVEALTNPENTGVNGDPGSCTQGGWCEICDVCDSTFIDPNSNLTLSKFWSQQSKSCV